MGFMVDKRSLEQVFFEYFGFLPITVAARSKA
jgi:hypothetical protein